MSRRLARLDPDGGPVLIGGGDGTIRAAAERLAVGGPPLGILPLGTMNLLARDLGVPDDPVAAIDALLDGEIRFIDLARANDQVFLCAAIAGVVPELAELREAGRAADSPLGAMRSLLAQLRETSGTGFEPRHFVLTPLQSPPRAVEALAVTIVNNRFAETPVFGQPMRRDRLDAGMLSAYVIAPETGGDLLRLIARIIRGSWVTDPCVTRIDDAGFSLRLAGMEEGLVSLDGEPMAMAMPFSFRLEPRRLACIAPLPAASDEDPAYD
jgi:diacylglycerol kinase family enzyme